MGRERRGFVMVQAWAVVAYIDQGGQSQKIKKPVRAPKSKRQLSDSDKLAALVKQAQTTVRDTIAKLQRTGATDCKGTVEKRISARVGHTDEDGAKRNVIRVAESITDAREKIKDILRDLQKPTGRKKLAAEKMTFNQVAAHFEKHYLIPAQYVKGEKIAGVRSLSPAQAAVNALKRHFGSKRIQEITKGDIRTYKRIRLSEPTRADRARFNRELRDNDQAQIKSTRAVASVNRELSKMRRILNIAIEEGWLEKNPFGRRDSVISTASERKRERILTRAEERKLLDACSGPRRQHLRPIVLTALDTGMRHGEIISLRWHDVDFDNGLINIQAFNTKTARERQVSLTARLSRELTDLWEQSPQDPRLRVFGVVNNVKRSFTAARKDAGLEDVRFHDLRHTAATRLVSLHLPLAEVGRVLGHSDPATTYRYVNANIETARRASAALDAFNAENETTQESFDVVN